MQPALTKLPSPRWSSRRRSRSGRCSAAAKRNPPAPLPRTRRDGSAARTSDRRTARTATVAGIAPGSTTATSSCTYTGPGLLRTAATIADPGACTFPRTRRRSTTRCRRGRSRSYRGGDACPPRAGGAAPPAASRRRARSRPRCGTDRAAGSAARARAARSTGKSPLRQPQRRSTAADEPAGGSGSSSRRRPRAARAAPHRAARRARAPETRATPASPRRARRGASSRRRSPARADRSAASSRRRAFHASRCAQLPAQQRRLQRIQARGEASAHVLVVRRQTRRCATGAAPPRARRRRSSRSRRRRTRPSSWSGRS